MTQTAPCFVRPHQLAAAESAMRARGSHRPRHQACITNLRIRSFPAAPPSLRNRALARRRRYGSRLDQSPRALTLCWSMLKPSSCQGAVLAIGGGGTTTNKNPAIEQSIENACICCHNVSTVCPQARAHTQQLRKWLRQMNMQTNTHTHKS